MKNTVVVCALFAVLVLASPVMAQGDDTPKEGSMAVGGYLGLGFSGYVGPDKHDAKPKFSGGIGGYFDYYLLSFLALSGGIDLMNKGARWEGDDGDARLSIFHLDIPLGVKFRLDQFRIGMALAFSFKLAGKLKTDDADLIIGGEYLPWNNFRRFNIVSKIVAGYGIPVGIVTMVPGMTWSAHLIRDEKDTAADHDNAVHIMTLLFTFGVEFDF